MKKVLTIAGSDSSGGAGIQADLKTFSALGVYGMSVITAVTAQNTLGVLGIEEISANMVGRQLDAIFQDLQVDAVKIGMVSGVEIIEAVAHRLGKYHVEKVVLDTVMVSKSGSHLLRSGAVKSLSDLLIPQAYVVTPNLFEAEVLTGMPVHTLEEMRVAAMRIHALGAKNVVIKGGHRIEDATDLLYDGREFHYFPGKRIETKNTHGTGCTFSSAIASYLALGDEVKEAVKRAKEYITGAIIHGLELGRGAGPTNHFYQLLSKLRDGEER